MCVVVWACLADTSFAYDARPLATVRLPHQASMILGCSSMNPDFTALSTSMLKGERIRNNEVVFTAFGKLIGDLEIMDTALIHAPLPSAVRPTLRPVITLVESQIAQLRLYNTLPGNSYLDDPRPQAILATILDLARSAAQDLAKAGIGTCAANFAAFYNSASSLLIVR